MSIRLIGVSGNAEHGKDTFIKYLMQWCVGHIPVAKIAFATPIKDGICSRFGVSPEYIESNKQMFRSLMQAEGDAWIAMHGQDYFINQADPQIRVNMLAGRLVIVSDVRKPIEERHIRSLGGIVIGVKSSRETKLTEQQRAHNSEALVSQVRTDIDVYNDGTRQQLVEAAGGLYELIRGIEDEWNHPLLKGKTLSWSAIANKGYYRPQEYADSPPSGRLTNTDY